MKQVKGLLGILATLLVLSLMVPSCCKMECEGGHITISLENYKRYEADTLIFLGYERNTNFSVLKDSALYDIPNAATDSSAVTHSHSIYADKDWIIKIPSLNKEFKIHNFKTATARCECGNKKYSILTSYSVNGVEVKSGFLKLPR